MRRLLTLSLAACVGIGGYTLLLVAFNAEKVGVTEPLWVFGVCLIFWSGMMVQWVLGDEPPKREEPDL